MKRYRKEKIEKGKFGDVKFTWTDDTEPKTIKSCIEHSVQPAMFFEELLQEAGYMEIQ